MTGQKPLHHILHSHYFLFWHWILPLDVTQEVPSSTNLQYKFFKQANQCHWQNFPAAKFLTVRSACAHLSLPHCRTTCFPVLSRHFLYFLFLFILTPHKHHFPPPATSKETMSNILKPQLQYFLHSLWMIMNWLQPKQHILCVSFFLFSF